MDDIVNAPTLITSAVALFTICNPIGSLPIFLQVTATHSKPEQRRIGLLVGVAVVVILAISLVAGTYILQAFGIDITAFKIAGNLLVAAIGWAMLLARPTPVASDDTVNSSPVVVPLAIPIVAGPGAIALTITFAHSYSDVLDYIAGIVIIIVVGATISLILYFGPAIERVLGANGMNVLTRVFGLIVLAIAVQSLLTALGDAFPGWIFVDPGATPSPMPTP
jgi:multiple antibiotic resistance protein